MQQKSNEKILILTILGAFVSFLLSNWLVQRIIERPFLNNVSLIEQRFNSPLNILFLTSGIIMVLGFLIKLIIKCKSSIQKFDRDQIEEFQEEEIQVEMNNNTFDKNIEKQTKKNQKNLESNNLRVQLLYYIKVALPKFGELTCFLYGIVNVGFQTMLFINILAKLVLSMLYGLITVKSKKYLKLFILTAISFLFALVLLHISYKSKIQKKSEQQIICGYLLIVGMCIFELVRKVMENNVLVMSQNISVIDQVAYQAKFNFISAYLLAVYLREEIYGLVFAVLHHEFIIKTLLLSIIILLGLLLKTFLRKQFGTQLFQFSSILQKNVSVFISLSYFSDGVQAPIIFVLCIIGVSTFINLLLQLSQSKKNNKTSFVQQKSLSLDLNVKNKENQNCISNLNDQQIQLKI